MILHNWDKFIIFVPKNKDNLWKPRFVKNVEKNFL